MSASVCMHCSPLTLVVQHGIKSPSVSLTCVSKNNLGERFYSNNGWLSSTSGKFYLRLNELPGETEPRSGTEIPAIKHAQIGLDASLGTCAPLFFGHLSGTGQIPLSQHLSFPRCRHGGSHTHLVVPAGHWRGDFSAVGNHPRRHPLGILAFLGSRSGYPFLPLALTGGRRPRWFRARPRSDMEVSLRRPRTIPWEEKRAIVFARDGYTCVYCESMSLPLHCDHAVPLSRGGSHDIANLVTACQSCNLRKHNKPLEQWLAEIA